MGGETDDFFVFFIFLFSIFLGGIMRGIGLIAMRINEENKITKKKKNKRKKKNKKKKRKYNDKL